MYILRFTSYRTVNTAGIDCKNKELTFSRSVRLIFFSEPHKTNILREKKAEIFNLNLVIGNAIAYV